MFLKMQYTLHNLAVSKITLVCTAVYSASKCFILINLDLSVIAIVVYKHKCRQKATNEHLTST